MFYLPSPIVLFKSLSTSDGLFFIRYTPEDTFKQKWFLVQINPEKIAILNMQRETAANYHITFLEQDPANKHLYDNKARWQPEWHAYKLDDNSVPVYGARMLFSPKRKQNLNKMFVMV